MKFFVLFASCLVAIASAKPSGLPLIYSAHPTYYQQPLLAARTYAIPAQGPLLQQYHSQDELGQYSYGYSGGQAGSKAEVRSFDGSVRGSYSYVDAKNELQTVDYTADALNGFRVAATNLPVAPIDTNVAPIDTNVAPIDTNVAPTPVEDTPEVAEAKLRHFELVAAAKNTASTEEKIEEPIIETARIEDDSTIIELPKAVEETPEVAAARSLHLAEVEKAKLRNLELPIAPVHVLPAEASPLLVRSAIAQPIISGQYLATPYSGQYIASPYNGQYLTSYSHQYLGTPFATAPLVRYINH